MLSYGLKVAQLNLMSATLGLSRWIGRVAGTQPSPSVSSANAGVHSGQGTILPFSCLLRLLMTRVFFQEVPFRLLYPRCLLPKTMFIVHRKSHLGRPCIFSSFCRMDLTCFLTILEGWNVFIHHAKMLISFRIGTLRIRKYCKQAWVDYLATQRYCR